jgi:hypothetical protein
MATTVTTATMKVTIIESITLNGKNQGSTNSLTVPNIANISKRIVNVPASEVEIVAMSSAVGSGTFITADALYIRITNLDDTNHVTLTFKSVGNHEFAVKLDKGQSFIYNGDLADGVAATMDASASALSLALADLVNITATANSGACDLEVFVACD